MKIFQQRLSECVSLSQFEQLICLVHLYASRLSSSLAEVTGGHVVCISWFRVDFALRASKYQVIMFETSL